MLHSKKNVGWVIMFLSFSFLCINRAGNRVNLSSTNEVMHITFRANTIKKIPLRVNTAQKRTEMAANVEIFIKLNLNSEFLNRVFQIDEFILPDKYYF